jgi:hypothetical protein
MALPCDLCLLDDSATLSAVLDSTFRPSTYGVSIYHLRCKGQGLRPFAVDMYGIRSVALPHPAAGPGQRTIVNLSVLRCERSEPCLAVTVSR